MQNMFESFESRVLMSATPTFTAAQKRDVKAITKTALAIYAKSDISLTQLATVADDVSAIAKVAHKPSTATVKALKADTEAAFADKVITPAEQTTLTNDVEAMLTSATVSTTLADQTATDVTGVINSANVTKAQAKTLVNEVSAFLKTFKA